MIISDRLKKQLKDLEENINTNTEICIGNNEDT